MEHISVAVSICQYLLCDMKLINCHAHQTLDVLAFFALDWLQSNFLTFSRLETLRGGENIWLVTTYSLRMDCYSIPKTT